MHMTNMEILQHMEDVLLLIQLKKESLSNSEQSQNTLNKLQNMENKQIKIIKEITIHFDGSVENTVTTNLSSRRKEWIYKSLEL